jgi:hypothetical protein
MEMAPFVRLLARVNPQLAFTLVTKCFDDSSIRSFHYSHGRARVWQIPNRFQEACWEMARKKFGKPGDEVYDDDDADWWADERMLAEGFGHWQTKLGNRGRIRRYDWYNQPMLRDLDVERELAFYSLAEKLFPKERRRRRAHRRKRLARSR